MDRDAAIDSFIEHVARLARLPFVTDHEIKELYGGEVAAAMGEVERINQEAMICRQCNSNCCREHGCEFYSPQFSQCPVHDIRPAICRFHFCEKFQMVARSTVKELSEIFLYSLSTASANGIGNVKFFNPPPFANTSPELFEIIKSLVNQVQSEEIKPGYGQRRIRQEIMKHHTPGNPITS